METTKSRINDLTGHIREYIETRIDIVKLDAADTISSAASSMASWVLVSILGLMMVMLITIGGAIAIGALINNYAGGCFIMAGIYFILMLVVYYNRENWVRIPVLNSIIKNIYNNE